MVKVGDIVRVTKSWALCGIMEGNEYEVTSVNDINGDTMLTVSNGVFFSSLHSADGDEWVVVG
jgi:hypothetical protein